MRRGSHDNDLVEVCYQGLADRDLSVCDCLPGQSARPRQDLVNHSRRHLNTRDVGRSKTHSVPGDNRFHNLSPLNVVDPLGMGVALRKHEVLPHPIPDTTAVHRCRRNVVIVGHDIKVAAGSAQHGSCRRCPKGCFDIPEVGGDAFSHLHPARKAWFSATGNGTRAIRTPSRTGCHLIKATTLPLV